MSRIASLINGDSRGSIQSYIRPLFWHHGESNEKISEEMRRMHANGIDSFIVESRPHPDFLGPLWWSDLRFIIEQAKSLGMKVWVFDDSTFPSGFAAGKIRDHYPELLKVFMKEKHIDAHGPMNGSSFKINAWLESGEEVVKVIVAKRNKLDDLIDADTLEDVTLRVVDGILYWDIPEGDWRVFILIKTPNGGEEATQGYLNPLDHRAVRAFIDIVYEAHYAHFKDDFGDTFAGFFSDEPRFGNHASYEAQVGKFKMVLPYYDGLLDNLSDAWGSDFGKLLPCLCYNDDGEIACKVRYTFMDVVSKLYAKNFTRQIGDWCRHRKVKLIGHVIEDNGAHARLGYGNGHFFRSIRGQDYSGFDIVSQIWPEITSGKFNSPFGVLDADFFYWGLGKMASSEGHIDPKKQGTTVCEIFGAYGWQEGLKLMKWLTDHVCVRGVNALIPHAFSPKEFPDSDCPPHFYAGGHNPQWRYFDHWSNYANRVCHLLSGGLHIAPVAVVYHAEAEWAGDYEPFEKVVKTLALRQIDCDVLPIDTLNDASAATVADGKLKVNLETYNAIVVPYSQAIPNEFAKRLLEMAKNGMRIIFMKDYPARSSDSDYLFGEIIDELKEISSVTLCDHANLVDYMMAADIYDIKVTGQQNSLRYYHYNGPDEEIYFFTNESKSEHIDTTIRFRLTGDPIAYDAMADTVHSLAYEKKPGETRVRLQLEPYESLFVIFTDNAQLNFDNVSTKFSSKKSQKFSIDGQWKVSTATAEEYPDFTVVPELVSLQNISTASLLPTFSGTIKYEIDFDYSLVNEACRKFIDVGEVYEIADVKLNGQDVGCRICPPYRFEVTDFIVEGQNQLQIEVTNTLAKKLGDNEFDRAMPQEPSGLIGPVSLLVESNLKKSDSQDKRLATQPA